MDNDKLIEVHPLEPFLPTGARMLMLGSFPPPRARWSMDFYYPNLQNDMWRIFGLVFFGDGEYFLEETHADGPGKRRTFCRDRIASFLTDKGIALSDTARTVIRHKGNASDKFLEIVEPRDMSSLLRQIPDCLYIVTTGDKATTTLASWTGAAEPPVGGYSLFEFEGRTMRHYRMPSSSRAYPLAIEKKAEVYGAMMRETGML